MGRLRYNKNALEILQKENLFINNPERFKGKWNSLFNNKNPIHIEIGSGKGTFIIEKTKQNPKINYIAIDKYPTILLKLNSKIKNENNLNNLLFTSFDACEIDKIFSKEEINKIYLNFCDPWPKKRNAKRRLTHILFLKLYKEILLKNSVIEFKTDNDLLYEFTLKTIEENNLKILYKTEDLYNDLINIKNNIPTDYEKKFLKNNIKIKKIIFSIQ